MLPGDLDAVYVSHLHADHVGGLEWLALLSRFGMPHRLTLLCPTEMVDSLGSTSLADGLAITDEGTADLSSYFSVVSVGPKGFTWGGIDFTLVPVAHVGSGAALVRSFGLAFTVAGGPEREQRNRSSLQRRQFGLRINPIRRPRRILCLYFKSGCTRSGQSNWCLAQR